MAEYIQIRSDGEIALPDSILRKANLKEGDLWEAIVESDGSIRLMPKTMDDRVLVEKQQLQDVSWATKQKNNKPDKK
jgi:bifunctional DNA-binding transcriptional regulator/antitoxin component of YhaV-PrlF toxin-antitoxin module